MNNLFAFCSSFANNLSRGPNLYRSSLRADKFLAWWMVICILVRLWLAEAIELIATFSPADEELFVLLANHILNGEWLGPYNHYTLVKGPGFPLFIAFVHQLGIPLITAEQILYSLVCVFVVVALRPLFRNQWPLVVIFTLLLLNPFMLSYSALGRIFRLGLSMPLALSIFGLFVGLLIRAGASFRTRLLWSALLGFCFSYSWYTREEGIWMVPSLALFSLYFLIFQSDFSRTELVKRIACLVLIGGIFYGFTAALSALNNKFYGAPVIVELKTPEFNSALGGLMNIDGLGSGREYPVSKNSQDAAFEVSPTFAKIKPVLYQDTHPFRLPPSYYLWIFRSAAYKSGYTGTLPEALAFYEKIGEELKAACENATLACLDRRPSIAPVWKRQYFEDVPRVFWDIWIQATTFRHFRDDHDAYLNWHTTATAEMTEIYRIVTRSQPVPGRKHQLSDVPPFYLRMKTEKLRILEDIGTIYKKVVPILFIAAMLAHLVLAGRLCVKGDGYFEVISGLIIFGGILSLITMLTYVKITLWGISRPLFSAYPLVLLYSGLMIVLFFSRLFRKDSINHQNRW